MGTELVEQDVYEEGDFPAERQESPFISLAFTWQTGKGRILIPGEHHLLRRVFRIPLHFGSL